MFSALETWVKLFLAQKFMDIADGSPAANFTSPFKLGLSGNSLKGRSRHFFLVCEWIHFIASAFNHGLKTGRTGGYAGGLPLLFRVDSFPLTGYVAIIIGS